MVRAGVVVELDRAVEAVSERGRAGSRVIAEDGETSRPETQGAIVIDKSSLGGGRVIEKLRYSSLVMIVPPSLMKVALPALAFPLN